MDKAHVLIIEDDPSVCELLFASLTRAGHRVSLSQSGEQALAQIEEDPPRVVVLDLNLPGMNGLDVCRTMRRDPWMSKIPVLMLTGQSDEDDIVTGLEVGADDYMTKPFSPKLVNARVMALLRRGHHEPGSVPGAGSLSSDDTLEPLLVKTLGRCELQLDGRQMSWAEGFSPAQRQLMALLIGTPEAKIAQEEVQAALWPESPSKKARSSFDSLLSRVRRTLETFLSPLDSKRYLLVKRGYLCLENCRVDAHEFRRLARKARQQVATLQYWPAEITYSSAFSLWQGRYVPSDFGLDVAVASKIELEQVYLEASLTFARLLAENGRYQQAAKLLRETWRYDPTNDALVRLLYQLCLAQENPVQAGQVLKQYEASLLSEKFSAQEVQDALQDFPKGPPDTDWFAED